MPPVTHSHSWHAGNVKLIVFQYEDGGELERMARNQNVSHISGYSLAFRDVTA